MSEKSDLAKLDSILNYIQDIDTIIKRHETIENALDDIEGQYILRMMAHLGALSATVARCLRSGNVFIYARPV
ncbi:MAG: hypothetical protein ABUK01_17815 [Leptospirales bacterium]